MQERIKTYRWRILESGILTIEDARKALKHYRSVYGWCCEIRGHLAQFKIHLYEELAND